MANKKKSGSRAKGSANAKTATVVKVGKSSKNSLLTSLKTWNITLAVVLAIQAIVILVMSKTVSLPVVTHYLTPDTLALQTTGHNMLGSAVRHLFDVNLAYLVAAFLIVPTIIHTLAVTVWRDHYKSDLNNGVNCLRTGEFILGGGLVLVALALITGIYEISLLVCLFSLIALGAILSHVLEFSRGKIKLPSWITLSFILFTVLVPWLIIAMYLKASLMYGSGLPHFVYWADTVTYILFAATAVNFYLSGRKKDRWADSTFGERIYMLISLASKTAVAWLLFAGVLR